MPYNIIKYLKFKNIIIILGAIYLLTGITLSLIIRDDQADRYFNELLQNLPHSMPNLFLHIIFRFFSILFWPGIFF
jgi:hypothetical protein